MRNAQLGGEAGVDGAALGAFLVQLLAGEVGEDDVLGLDAQRREVAGEHGIAVYMFSTRGMPMRTRRAASSARRAPFACAVNSKRGSGSATVGGWKDLKTSLAAISTRFGLAFLTLSIPFLMSRMSLTSSTRPFRKGGDDQALGARQRAESWS